MMFRLAIIAICMGVGTVALDLLIQGSPVSGSILATIAIVYAVSAILLPWSLD